MIEPIVGKWWLDDGQDSGVWPVTLHVVTPFGVVVEGTLESGPYYQERITVSRSRVYDSAFNRPGDAFLLRRES